MEKLLLIYLVIINIIGFVIMGVDKKRAIKKEWRIPESILILIAYIGGGIGTFIGMQIFRHKTRKIKFIILFPLAFLIYLYILIQILIIL